MRTNKEALDFIEQSLNDKMWRIKSFAFGPKALLLFVFQAKTYTAFLLEQESPSIDSFMAATGMRRPGDSRIRFPEEIDETLIKALLKWCEEQPSSPPDLQKLALESE